MSPTLTFIIQSLVSVVIVMIVGAIIRVMFNRLLEEISNRITELSNKISNLVPKTECQLKCGSMDCDIEDLKKDARYLSTQATQLQEKVKNTDILKQDFIREISNLNDEFYIIHEKIDAINQKLYSRK